MVHVMSRSRRILCCGLLVGASWWAATAKAQDGLYVTNLDQLVSEAYSTDHSDYLALSPWDWRAWTLDEGDAVVDRLLPNLLRGIIPNL